MDAIGTATYNSANNPQTGAVCGVKLPAGLRESDKLPEPLFTPSTKAETGHDMNITEREMANVVGDEATKRLKELTLEVYRRAADFALSRRIIIADTKLEFGVKDGQVILVDEVLTPDSSRFWSAVVRQAVPSGLSRNC